jgi:hypothetical protein
VLFTLEDTFLSVAVTFSPGLAVPEASTTSLVLPPDGGLKGAGPDVPSAPERSQGFGGEPAKCNYMLITSEINVYVKNNSNNKLSKRAQLLHCLPPIKLWITSLQPLI